MAALPERARQILDRHAETGGEQFAVARNIGDDGHGAPADIFKDNDRTSSGAIQFEDDGGRLEPQVDRLAYAEDLVGIFSIHHAQEPAQALIILDEGVAPDLFVHGFCPQRLTTFALIPNRSSARPTVWSTMSSIVFG